MLFISDYYFWKSSMYFKFYLNHLHLKMIIILNENLNFLNSQGPVKKFGKSRVQKIKVFLEKWRDNKKAMSIMHF